jgi:hypothetical protein
VNDRRREAIEQTAKVMREDAAKQGRAMTQEQARERVISAQVKRDKGA